MPNNVNSATKDNTELSFPHNLLSVKPNLRFFRAAAIDSLRPGRIRTVANLISRKDRRRESGERGRVSVLGDVPPLRRRPRHSSTRN